MARQTCILENLEHPFLNSFTNSDDILVDVFLSIFPPSHL